MDPIIGSGIVSGALGLGGSLINNLFATNNANKTNDMNYKIAKETNEINKGIADQNLALQQDWNEYQKALQQQIFEREDTAYQRTAADMRSAGLNPLSMNGTNGAGQVVSTSAPQNNFQAQQSSPMQQATLALDSFSGLVSGITSIISNINEVKSGQLQRDQLQAQIDRLKLENDMLSRENDHKVKIGHYDTDMLPEKIMTHLMDWTQHGRAGQVFNFGLKDLINLFDPDQEIGIPIIDDLKKEILSPATIETIRPFEKSKEEIANKKSEKIKNDKNFQDKFNYYKKLYGGK